MLPVPAPAILFHSVPDGAVLLDTRGEVYFGLNGVGARIWRLLPPATRSMDELCAALAAAYPGVPVETLRRDADNLLRALAEAGLVGAAEGMPDDAAALAGPLA